MKIPASLPDDAADDPDVARRARDSHSDSSSSSSSTSQSAPGEGSSDEGGSTAPDDGSPSAPSGGDRELAEANTEEIDKLGNTLDWLTKLVMERTDSPSEAAGDGSNETADRGFE